MTRYKASENAAGRWQVTDRRTGIRVTAPGFKWMAEEAAERLNGDRGDPLGWARFYGVTEP